MPRTETRYFCNICNKVYFEIQEAIECEKNHLIPESISSPEYLKSDRKNIYPYSILINFTGGKSVRYYRNER